MLTSGQNMGDKASDEVIKRDRATRESFITYIVETLFSQNHGGNERTAIIMLSSRMVVEYMADIKSGAQPGGIKGEMECSTTASV